MGDTDERPVTAPASDLVGKLDTASFEVCADGSWLALEMEAGGLGFCLPSLSATNAEHVFIYPTRVFVEYDIFPGELCSDKKSVKAENDGRE